MVRGWYDLILKPFLTLALVPSEKKRLCFFY